MEISGRIVSAGVSTTIRLSEMARQLRRAKREIYDLAEGEPDFDTPRHITYAAFEAAKIGATRYTDVAGTPELREAVAWQFKRLSGLNVEPNNIVVGTGAKQLIFNALMCMVNPGDEAVIPTPCWVSYADMVRICDGIPVLEKCRANAGFKLSAGDLEDLITPKTRCLILNSPCNPTGMVFSRDELSALAVVLRKHPSVAVVCDDIYQEIVFDGVSFATLAAVAPDLSDRILTVHGVSKTYAMTGWRIGYAAGPSDLIAAMTKLQGQSTTNASSVSQAAALAALNGPQDFLVKWRAVYRQRRDLVAAQLADVTGMQLYVPSGAFYHFADCSGLLGMARHPGRRINSDDGLSLYLLESVGVATVPGSAFAAPGYLRLCFARSEDYLVRACGRIGKAVKLLVD